MRIGDDMELGMRNEEIGIPLPPPSSFQARGRSGIQNSPKAGFTLIELIVVVAIIGILAAIAMPAMQNAPIRAREAVIRADLYQLRSCIDQHLADKGQYPPSLEALVEEGYLRGIPMDPFSGSNEGAWTELYANPEQLEEFEPFDDEYSSGEQVIDVKYADEARVALDGSLISEW